MEEYNFEISFPTPEEKENVKSKLIEFSIARNFEEAELQIKKMREYRELERNYSKDLYDGLMPLLTNLYDDPNRFIYEIMQNADDCRYKEGVLPSINFEITHEKNQMIISYNEVGFIPKNIMAITGIAESTKNKKSLEDARIFESQTKNNENYNYTEIGEKGIGFKSLFRACDSVTIRSGFYSFTIESKHPTIPTWEGYGEKLNGTSIVLKFKEEGYSKKLFDTLKEKYCLKNKIDLLNGNPILFLKQTRKIIISDGNEKFSIECNSIINDTENSMEQISINVQINDKSVNEILCWKYEKIIEFNEEETKARYGENREEKIKHKIIIIAPIGVDNYNRGLLYSFFPTNIVLNVPLIIHAPFRLGTSREGIIYEQNNLWDKKLINEIEDTYMWEKFYLGLKEKLEKPMDVVKFIPDDNNLFKNSNVKISLIEIIKKYPILYSIEGELVDFEQSYITDSIGYDLFNIDNSSKQCFENNYGLQDKKLLNSYYINYKDKFKIYDLNMIKIGIDFLKVYFDNISINNTKIDLENPIHLFIKNILIKQSGMKTDLKLLSVFPKKVEQGAIFTKYNETDKWFISKSISYGKYNYLDTDFMGNDTFYSITGKTISDLNRETITNVIVDDIVRYLTDENWNDLWDELKELYALWHNIIHEMPQYHILDKYCLPEELDADNIFRDLKIVSILDIPTNYFDDKDQLALIMDKLGIRKKIKIVNYRFDSVSKSLLETANKYFMSLEGDGDNRIIDEKYIVNSIRISKLCKEAFEVNASGFQNACSNDDKIKKMIPVKMNNDHYKMYYSNSDNWIWYRFYIECSDKNKRDKIIKSWGGCVVFVDDDYTKQYLESIGIMHISSVGDAVNNDHFSINRVKVLKDILKDDEYQEFCFNLCNKLKIEIKDKLLFLFCASELNDYRLDKIGELNIEIKTQNLKSYDLVKSIKKLSLNDCSKIKVTITDVSEVANIIDEEVKYYLDELVEALYFNNNYEKIKMITSNAYSTELVEGVPYIASTELFIINSKLVNFDEKYEAILDFISSYFGIKKEKLSSIKKVHYSSYEKINLERTNEKIEVDDINKSIEYFSKWINDYKMNNEELKRMLIQPFNINSKYFVGYSNTCPICGSTVHTEISGFRIVRKNLDGYKVLIICCQNCKSIFDYEKKIDVKVNGKNISEFEGVNSNSLNWTFEIQIENTEGSIKCIDEFENLEMSLAHYALICALNYDKFFDIN